MCHRFQSKAAPTARSRRATPPIVPPTITPVLSEVFVFSVEDASDVEVDRIPEEEEEVRAAIPGDIERVREEAVDAGAEEVLGFVLVEDEVVPESVEEVPWKETGLIRMADPLTTKSP